ncbi:MAG: DUF1028 domain-containing protein [Candidatus Hermodarchaeota archaeon]
MKKVTFSIVGYDPKTGDFGVAVQSKFICVGAIVSHAEADIGAIATQAHANTNYGPRGLELLKTGKSAQEVINHLISDDEQRESRQVAVINGKGAAAHTGKDCFEWAGHIVGNNYSCQGNILTGEETIQEMAKAFETTNGELAVKLLAALLAADKEGLGDVRGKQSAALLVVRDKGGYGGYTDRLVDIRVDEHVEPIKELVRIYEIYDMVFLSNEDPSRLLTIEDTIAETIKQVLTELNYLKPEKASPASKWGEVERQALEAWVGINNFENKWRDDGKIWQSIYDYIKKEKGTPFIDIKRMSEK